MYKPSNTGRYTVKPHNPLVAWSLRGAALLALAAGLWWTYEYGRVQGGYHREAAEREIAALNDEIAALRARIDALVAENARLASDSAIDATATQQVSDRLRELNEEILELKEELAFYRQLLSPADREPGLQVMGVQLSPQEDGVYAYRIVLTQWRAGNRHAEGVVRLAVEGRRGAAEETLEGAALLGDAEALPFRFKTFQRLEGRLQLPPGFTPKALALAVEPKGRGLKPIERRYDWTSLVTGG